MKRIAFGIILALAAPLATLGDSWSEPEIFSVVENVVWHPDSTRVQVYCKKAASGQIYQYFYNWAGTGRSIEQAKILMATLLTAQANGRSIDLFGDHGGPGVWNNFSAVKVKN